ncbi:hypothetical protein VTI74DRAFT_755 [Chaetomium olivicolor]
MASEAADHTEDEQPPFSPREAHLGGIPSPIPDAPIIILFLVLFTVALLVHLLFTYVDNTRPPTAIDRINTTTPTTTATSTESSSRSTSTLCSAASTPHPEPTPTHLLPCLCCFFLLTRLAALATRLAWAYSPSAIRLEMASSIIAPAGTVLLVIANLLVARRFLRDYAAFGFHPAVARMMRVVVICAAVSLVMGVSVHADVYFTEDEKALQECRVIGLVAGCLRVACAVVPVLAVILGGWLLNAEEEVRRDRGRWKVRAGMILGVAMLLTCEEGFRTGVAFEGREAGSRAWFLHKGAYYCFTFLLEAVIMYVLLAARLNRRFRLRPRVVREKREGSTLRERLQDRLNAETEVFGDSR